MDPVTKTQLIESFVTVLDQAGVLKPVDVSIDEVQLWCIIVDFPQIILHLRINDIVIPTLVLVPQYPFLSSSHSSFYIQFVHSSS